MMERIHDEEKIHGGTHFKQKKNIVIKYFLHSQITNLQRKSPYLILKKLFLQIWLFLLIQ